MISVQDDEDMVPARARLHLVEAFLEVSLAHFADGGQHSEHI